MTRVSTPWIFVLSLLAARSAFGATEINIYSSSYSPVAGTSVTITAQFANGDGIPAEDSGFPTAVSWTLTGPGTFTPGGLTTASTNTNGLGIATVTLNTSATAGKTYTVTATSGVSATTMNITTTASSGSGTKYIFTITNQTAGHDGYAPVIGNSSIPTSPDVINLAIQLVDANNNPVNSAKTVTVSKSFRGSSYSSIATVNTNASGSGSTTFSVGNSSGTFVFKASDGSATGLSLPVTTDATTSLDALSTPIPFVDYGEIQTLFTNKCAFCHDGTFQTPDYRAPTTNSYPHIVGVTSSENSPENYVDPSDGGFSLIFEKIHEPSPPNGYARMPDGGPYLPSAEQQLFRDWMNQGAHDIAKGFSVTVQGTATPDAGSTVTVTAQFQDKNSLSLPDPGMLVTWTNTTTGLDGTYPNGNTSRTDSNGIATIQFTTAGNPANITYTFTASSANGAYTGTSGSITTKVGPASQYIVNSTNYNPVAGNSVTITAQLADAFGNSVSASKTVNFSATGGVGSFSPSSSIATNTSGLATVTYTTSTTPGTAVTITASDGSQSGVSSTITTKFAQYLVTTTATGSITAGQTITIKAQLADGSGNPLTSPDQTVSFSATGSGYTFTPASQLSSSGLATVQFKDTTAGSVTLTADSGTSTGTLTLTIAPDVAHDYKVSATSTTPTVNTSVTVTAQLEDQFGNPTGSGQSVTFSATAPGGTFTPATVTANGSGLATTSFKAGTTAGSFSINATDGTNSGSLSVTSKAGPAAKYVVTPASTSITAGTNNVNVTAQLSDQYGNAVSGSGTVTWAVIGVGGSFSSNTSPVVGGLASVNFNAPTTTGTDNISANDGTYSGNSPTITINPGSPNKYILTSTTLSPIAGSSVQVTAKLADSFGNLLTSYSGTMNWSSTGAGGSLSNSTNVVNGVATTTFTTSTTAGTGYTVTGTDTAIPVCSGTVTLTSVAGPPTQCVLLVAPNNPTVGTAVTINGQLKDANNNVVTTSGIVIIWSANFSGIFQNATSTTNASGQVSNSFTTGPVAGLNYIISVTDGAAINSSSAIFTSVAGAPSAYSLTLSSSSPVAGTGITATAQLTDALGNALPVIGQTVTWGLSGTTGSFSAPTSVTNASGVATITYTTSTVSGDSEKIIATTGAITGTSATVTTVPGPGAKYVVTASNTSVGAGVGVRIAAALVDAHGNAVPTSGNAVAWSTMGTNGFFSTPSSTTDNTGTAYVVLSTSPTGGVSYVVTALDSGGLTGSSPQINVAAFAGTTGVPPIITSPLSAITGAGVSFSYTVTALGDQPITFNATSLPEGLVFSGDTISGAVNVAGTFIVHVTATNAAGSDAIDLLIISAPALTLSLDKARLKLVFSSQSGDSLSATFSLTLPDGKTAQNSTMSIQFGGASFSNLATSSKSKSSTSVSVKPMAKGSSSMFVSLRVTGANLKALLAANGLVNDNLNHVAVSLPIQIIITTIDAQTFYSSGTGVLTYTASKGKIGIGTK